MISLIILPPVDVITYKYVFRIYINPLCNNIMKNSFFFHFCRLLLLIFLKRFCSSHFVFLKLIPTFFLYFFLQISKLCCEKESKCHKRSTSCRKTPNWMRVPTNFKSRQRKVKRKWRFLNFIKWDQKKNNTKAH